MPSLVGSDDDVMGVYDTPITGRVTPVPTSDDDVAPTGANDDVAPTGANDDVSFPSKGACLLVRDTTNTSPLVVCHAGFGLDAIARGELQRVRDGVRRGGLSAARGAGGGVAIAACEC
jgi:hypothetical protein